VLAQLVIEQGAEQYAALTAIAAKHHLWQPLFDIIAAMPSEAQQQSASLLQGILKNDASLQDKWQPLLEQRELNHLLAN
jgi:hypothetical protein